MEMLRRIWDKLFSKTPESVIANRTKKYDSTPRPKKCNKCIYNNRCSSSPSSDCIYAFEEDHFPLKGGFH